MHSTQKRVDIERHVVCYSPPIIRFMHFFIHSKLSAHSKLQGWSYAVLVHPMGGSHHHIGGSVGSHLPEIQQHAQSWTSVHVCGRPWAPVSKHIMSRYGVLPWLWPPSKAWLVDPMVGLSRHVKDLTTVPILMSCSSTLKLVALRWPADAPDQGCGRWVVGGLYCAHIHASPAVPSFMGAQLKAACCMT